ncbi:MAG: AraC family transcriptional regulator [Oceanospirillaceae bacterium]|nr:AraC family transcriptional regulator [Oceanospirillaceae bacterium]
MANAVATLSHINLTLHQPTATLRQFLKDYWFISSTAGSPLQTEYLPADTGSGIHFNFGSSMIMGDTIIKHGCAVSGPNTQSMTLQLGPQVDAVGIRFHPGMAYPFFQEPLADFLSPVEPYSQLTQRLALTQVYDQLATTTCPSARTQILDEWLLHQLSDSLNVQPNLTTALNWLEQQSQDPIATLPQHVNLGQRQLERLFKQWVGISPTHYRRIVRVNTVRSRLRNSSYAISLSNEAINAGYFDQAHMNREFKRVVGLTPGQYLKCLNRSETGSP